MPSERTIVFDINSITDKPVFSLAGPQKAQLYQDALCQLTKYHYTNCPPYRRIIDILGVDPDLRCTISQVPFIPARLFKDYDFLSVERSSVVKVMTSSGTTGQRVSRVFLDRITAVNQARVLARIVTDFIGAKRLPMLVVDAKPDPTDRSVLSARGAGILGFSMFGCDLTYALDGRMRLDLDAVEAFCDKHKDEDIFLFGFTYIIWKYFYKALAESGKRLSFKNAVLIHGGGWKKLSQEAISNDAFKASLKGFLGINRVHNYYGLAEQAGSIFMECQYGYLHSSIFSDVIIRRSDFSVCGMRQTGLTQVISLLPLSYPGHSILSEDAGEIVGEDDCPCGRLGRYFKIHGRVKDAQIRGCSDAYAYS